MRYRSFFINPITPVRYLHSNKAIPCGVNKFMNTRL